MMQEYYCIALLQQIAPTAEIKISQVNHPKEKLPFDCVVISGDVRYYTELKQSNYSWLDRIDSIDLKLSKLVNILKSIQFDEVKAQPAYMVICNDGLVVVDLANAHKVQTITRYYQKTQLDHSTDEKVPVNVLNFTGKYCTVIPFQFDFEKAKMDAEKMMKENEKERN